MRKVTITDVAKLAKVSPMTVSRALRQPGSVSDELRTRINGAVRRLGYVPNLAASRLASSRTQLIGIVVPTLYNVIFAEYLLALHEELIREGFHVVVVNSRYSESEEEEAVKALIGQRAEAIVVAGIHHTPLTRRILSRSRIPVIETFELSEDPIGLNIGFAQEHAAAAAVRHLIAGGRRRVAYFAGNLDDRALARLVGYRQAMSEAGLEDEIAITQIVRLSTIQLGSELLRKRIEERGLPDAIFCIDDNLALGAMQECRKRRILVPQDIAVIGFHDLEFAACLSPSLSSVATRRYETGQLAAQKLIEALKGGKPLRREQIDLGFELIPRESTVVDKPARR
jgi:LacI family gluconate utilization system Gnt-I transcriptional repressor